MTSNSTNPPLVPFVEQPRPENITHVMIGPELARKLNGEGWLQRTGDKLEVFDLLVEANQKNPLPGVREAEQAGWDLLTALVDIKDVALATAATPPINRNGGDIIALAMGNGTRREVSASALDPNIIIGRIEKVNAYLTQLGEEPITVPPELRGPAALERPADDWTKRSKSPRGPSTTTKE